MSDHSPPDIPVPSEWATSVRSAVIHVISLAHHAIVAARGWAANSINARVRLAAKNDRLNQEIQLLREELRIKDVRLTKIDPRRRPYYPPTERMAILELRAARAHKALVVIGRVEGLAGGVAVDDHDVGDPGRGSEARSRRGNSRRTRGLGARGQVEARPGRVDRPRPQTGRFDVPLCRRRVAHPVAEVPFVRRQLHVLEPGLCKQSRRS